MASTVANAALLRSRKARRSTSRRVPRARAVVVRASAERGVAAAVQARLGRTIEECEADAAAGKFPAPPPFARPRATEGTPEIRPLDLTKRPRRNRRSPALREAFQETRITPANLVLRCSSTKVKRTVRLELCLAASGLGGGTGFLMRCTSHEMLVLTASCSSRKFLMH